MEIRLPTVHFNRVVDICAVPCAVPDNKGVVVINFIHVFHLSSQKLPSNE